MKIIAVARNYSEHAKEMNHPLPDEPVIFMKPRSALLDRGEPFYYPDFTKEIDYETEIVLKISKNGKHFSEKFSGNYYDEVSVGIDFTARDLQRKCKEKGLPWEIAKSFDNSAAVGSFIHKDELNNAHDLDFSLRKNGEVVQKGNTSQMIFSIDHLLSYISSFFTLNKGDIVFTGTPVGVGKIKVGDMLEGYIGQEKLLSCEVK